MSFKVYLFYGLAWWSQRPPKSKLFAVVYLIGLTDKTEVPVWISKPHHQWHKGRPQDNKEVDMTYSDFISWTLFPRPEFNLGFYRQFVEHNSMQLKNLVRIFVAKGNGCRYFKSTLVYT